jgi:hypothetical protein
MPKHPKPLSRRGRKKMRPVISKRIKVFKLPGDAHKRKN